MSKTARNEAAPAAAVEPGPARRKPGRPRSADADRAILAAALGLLADVGLQALSIEQVATRAGVGRKSVYRRWPSKDALVSDAIRSVQAQMPLIDTGDLRHDLIAMHTAALTSLATAPLMRPLYLRLAGEFHNNPAAFQVFLTELVQPRFEQFTEAVRKAQDRGDLRRDLDPDLAVDILIGPMLFRWAFTGILRPAPSGPEAAALAEQTVDLALSSLGTRGDPA